MSHLIRNLVDLLLEPLILALLLALLGAVLRFTLQKKRLARWCFGLAVFWLVVFSSGIVPRLLAGPLENQYPTLRRPDTLTFSRPVHILVLGGGHTLDGRFPAIDQLTNTALGRMAEGLRLYHEIPGSKLVFSGWSTVGVSSQAEVGKRAAVELRIPEQDILVLPEPRNTREEARAYREAYGAGFELILVTDALHLPRAMMLFRKEGLKPIPAPTNHVLKKNPVRNELPLLPQPKYLALTHACLHEYVGILWGKLNA